MKQVSESKKQGYIMMYLLQKQELLQTCVELPEGREKANKVL